MTNRDAAKEQPWFKRLKNLATNEKTPEAIAKDLVCALHAIECRPSPAADVKALREAIKALLAAPTVTVHVGYDSGAGGGNYIYADAVRTDDEAFEKLRVLATSGGGE